MMQMPLSSYPHFSQFLQLQQLHQQRYSRGLLSTSSPATDLTGMLSSSSRRSATSCSEASTGTPSSSPSPPLSITENLPPNTAHQNSSKSAKSFTIDAILGIRGDREIDKADRDQLNVIPGNFHPRLGLQLSNSHLELPGGYSNSLDLTSATLEIGARIDMTRFSTTSRDILGFQLPADLTTSSEVSSYGGSSEITRRNLQNQISTFQNSNSCSGLSEKSPSDISKKCGGKSKRVRTIFTPEQLERLEAEFERQQYMVGPERLYLAHTLQLTEAQVKVWFQNRRIKWRKQHLEIQQQRLAAIKQQNPGGDIEDSDDESADSNNYSFSADNGDGGSFFKSAGDNDLDGNLEQYKREKPPQGPSFHGETASETARADSNSEKA